MTAPDPRLEEIEGRANNPFAADNTLAQADADRDYLLAELRKAQDKLGRVEGLCDEAVHIHTMLALRDNIRAAVADATGGERGHE